MTTVTIFSRLGTAAAAVSLTDRCQECAGTGCDPNSSAEDEYEPCEFCGGSGLHRNYLGEAFRIVSGESPMLPERGHLLAVVEQARERGNHLTRQAAGLMIEETLRGEEAVYEGPRCPTCDEPASFTPHWSTWTEPHGEPCESEWLTCNACGAMTDEQEINAQIARHNPKPERKPSGLESRRKEEAA